MPRCSLRENPPAASIGRKISNPTVSAISASRTAKARSRSTPTVKLLALPSLNDAALGGGLGYWSAAAGPPLPGKLKPLHPDHFFTRGLDGAEQYGVTARLSGLMQECKSARHTGRTWPRPRQSLAMHVVILYNWRKTWRLQRETFKASEMDSESWEAAFRQKIGLGRY